MEEKYQIAMAAIRAPQAMRPGRPESACSRVANALGIDGDAVRRNMLHVPSTFEAWVMRYSEWARRSSARKDGFNRIQKPTKRDLAIIEAMERLEGVRRKNSLSVRPGANVGQGKAV